MSRLRAARPGTAILLAGACALLTACGSVGQASATATGAANPPLRHVTRDVAFSECMRTHGVPDFPDPLPGGGLHIPLSINAQLPAFHSAQSACARFLPDKGGPPPTPAGERAAAVTFARCMRVHGVPQFPDPALTPPRNAGRVLVLQGMVFAIGVSIDPKAPAFQHAAGACGLQDL